MSSSRPLDLPRGGMTSYWMLLDGRERAHVEYPSPVGWDVGGLGVVRCSALCSAWVRTKVRINQSPPGQATEGQRDGTGTLQMEDSQQHLSLTYGKPGEGRDPTCSEFPSFGYFI